MRHSFLRDWGEKFVINWVRWSCRIRTESYHFSLGFIYLCDGIDKTQTKVIRFSVYLSIPHYPIYDKKFMLDLYQKRTMHHLLILSVYLSNLPPLSIIEHLVIELSDPDLREDAIRELSKVLPIYLLFLCQSLMSFIGFTINQNLKGVVISFTLI